MKIAVLGGGHGCYAAAADLSEQGHEVRLWRRDQAAFEPVRATGAIMLVDHRGARAVPIANATRPRDNTSGTSDAVFFTTRSASRVRYQSPTRNRITIAATAATENQAMLP